VEFSTLHSVYYRKILSFRSLISSSQSYCQFANHPSHVRGVDESKVHKCAEATEASLYPVCQCTGFLDRLSSSKLGLSLRWRTAFLWVDFKIYKSAENYNF